MKQLGSVLCSLLKARRLFAGVMTALIAGSFTVTALMKGNNGQQVPAGKQASQGPSRNHPTADFWQEVPEMQTAASPAAFSGKQVEVQPRRFRAFTLNRVAMQSALAAAPREFTAAARQATFILSIPSPAGDFKRFAVHESPVMEPALAAKHPDIKTYAGNGIDEAGATVRFDLTPLGFHASVRGPSGSWYIDPYYHLDQSIYVSYFRGDLDNPHGVFTESEANEALISADHSFYRVGDTVKLSGSGFSSSSVVKVTISDSENPSRTRTLEVKSDEAGSFQLKFAASTDGTKAALTITAADGANLSSTSYEVFSRMDQQPLLATGDQLRIYRLAMITDPGYATYFGGSANVTAAKVTLINRVDQLYEEDISIRLVLVANNDLLNLDIWAQATGPNGPCGAAGCFTQTQVTGCASTTRARFVIGQIIGASNYDIGHLALGEPGGGVANLGVVGRSNKAGGCTGIPTPVGDFYAVDYVAHEMGHQFSGNHPFNGTQLNCSGSNRNAGTSVEPGSGSSVMAYAGICLTDDLQRHSDPYFSERSQQEIATYTSGNQAAINEVQTASLRHFGGGNEVQTVTFGPGYATASTIQPLSLAINAAPSASSLGGATETGNTVTIATGNSHTLQVGDTVTIAGVAVAGYNGTFTVTAIISSRSFQYTNPTSGLATSGGGTVTLAIPGATESGNTVTISTSTAHGRSMGDIVVIAGVGVGGYNGTFTITAVPTTRTFQYTNPTAGLGNSGSGTSTYSSPFQVRIGGNDSAVIGGSGQAYTNANLTAAINAIAGFAGTATVTGAASTGFTVTYTGAAAGVDVSNIQLVNLSCGGCFSSVEETNHGGANDSFTLNYNGTISAPITNGSNYTAAGILAALTPILPVGGTATVAGFGGGTFNNTGFQVTFTGTFAMTNVPVLLVVQDFSSGLTGFVNETDKGGAVDNKGGSIMATGDAVPVVTAPAQFTIPLRTPFALTGSATDGDNDTLVYSWEQNDRGAGAGITLLNNTKTSGPLFAMFSKSGQISDADSLLYGSPGENNLTTSPTRVFPDLQQILADNTNAGTGTCANALIGGPIPQSVTECFSEFLPTSDYAGFAGTNAAPLSLHFRFTARDGKGGVDSADTTLLIDNTAGPLRVTSQGSPIVYNGPLLQPTVTWSVNNTNTALLAPNVKISLSTDGGATFPYVLVASTPNDGSELVTLPNVSTTTARLKVEAVGNIFFDINHSDFTIQSPTAASASISGRVTTAAGAPVAGATINLDGARAAQTITDSNGNYSFAHVELSGFYTVTPALANHTFSPANRSFALVGNKTDAVFTALPNAVASTNAIDTNEFFVRQQYLDFLGREPDREGFEFWNGKLRQCNGAAECLRQQRIEISAAFFGSAEFQQSGGYIYRLYEAGLGRQLSYTEFAEDHPQVIGGSGLDISKAAFASAFVNRPEFLQRYQANTSTGSFVDAMLQSLRGAAGVDLEGERETLIGRYNAGNTVNESRVLVLRDLAENETFAGAVYNPSFVWMEYSGYLRRGPEPAGYAFWLNVLNNADPGNYRGMVCSFITSTEYQRRFGSVITHSNAECGR
jgi:Metallo-peptidase family M12B Reprolysin-like/Carboxypeptidase regulatory-like domain/Domain of unknown function (DUF4214)